MGGLPKGSDAKKCIDALTREFGWTYQETTGGAAHAAGIIMCPHRERGGCRKSVNGTGLNTARKIWQYALNCTHDYAPGRRHW